MQSKAATVSEYFAELPEDRREAIAAVREVILANLESDFEEGMLYGMICYYVPLRIYPAGYCDPRAPLPLAGLASQKNHMSLYTMANYGDQKESEEFRRAWAATGKKLDMGKSCIRFKRLEDLALDVIADHLRKTTVKKYIEQYERSIRTMNKAASQGASGSSKPAKKKAAAKKSAGRTMAKATKRAK